MSDTNKIAAEFFARKAARARDSKKVDLYKKAAEIINTK